MATTAPVALDPARPEAWLDDGFEALYALSWRDCLEAQVAAMKLRFEQLGTSVAPKSCVSMTISYAATSLHAIRDV